MSTGERKKTHTKRKPGPNPAGSQPPPPLLIFFFCSYSRLI